MGFSNREHADLKTMKSSFVLFQEVGGGWGGIVSIVSRRIQHINQNKDTNNEQNRSARSKCCSFGSNM